MLASLQGVSDLVEEAKLGTAYVGLDGLEAMYGGEAWLAAALLNAVLQDLTPRVGVGGAKFPAYVAARTARPLVAARVSEDVAGFLSPHAIDLLPVSPTVREELRNFGPHTLGDVAAMKAEALIDRLGQPRQRAWELSNGIDVRPLVPLKQEESVAEHIALPFASASMELLLTAVDNLLSRAYARPGMQGRYAGGVVMECVLYRAQPWRKEFRFKQAVGDWRQVSRIVRGRLESDHPQAPVEELTLELSGITGESGTQLSLLADVRGDQERRLAGAERQLQAWTGGKPALYRWRRWRPGTRPRRCGPCGCPSSLRAPARCGPCRCRPRWRCRRDRRANRRRCCWGSGGPRRFRMTTAKTPEPGSRFRLPDPPEREPVDIPDRQFRVDPPPP